MQLDCTHGPNEWVRRLAGNTEIQWQPPFEHLLQTQRISSSLGKKPSFQGSTILAAKYVMKCARDPSKADENGVLEFTLRNNNGN